MRDVLQNILLFVSYWIVYDQVTWSHFRVVDEVVFFSVKGISVILNESEAVFRWL